jgi:probable phosphoglycerate mutase
VARKIFVVRHGETEWSRAGRHTGLTDVPLTEVGRSQASALATTLGGHEFSLVLSSPLQRARETCALAGFTEQAVDCDDLHEWDYGEYEGLTTPEIWASRPDWNLWRDGCPAGELPADVAARADRALEVLRDVDGDAALVFAHGHLLRVLAARWMALPASVGGRLALWAAALGVLGYERSTPVIWSWNIPPP